jgi:acetyltransferase
VASHTGALAGSDKVYSAMFNQTGVIRARDVEDLFDLANVCATPKHPKGNRTAIITISGGAASLMCDRCEEVGLKVTELLPETEKALRCAPDFPAFATTHNPVDVTAELVARPKLLRKPLEITLADPNVDCLVIFLGMQLHNGEELARTIVEATASSDKTVIVNWIAAPEVSVKILREASIPVFPDPGRGMRSLGALVNYVKRRERYLARQSAAKPLPVTPAGKLKAAQTLVAAARSKGATTLTESEGKQLLALYGIPTPARTVVTSAKDAAKAAKKMGFPVVMKIVSPDILHKTEAGGVRLGVKDPKAAEDAFNGIMKSAKAYNKKAKLEGVLIEEMVSDAEQVIVGFKQDRLFGPAITMGMGGIYVELFRDASLRVAPFDADEALAMIQETKAYKLLTGFRGAKLRDVAALTKVITAVARLALDFRYEIAEFDVNPVMVLPRGKGVRAVDAAVVLK